MNLRSHSAVNRLPNYLIGKPVVTVKQVAENLGVDFTAANRALNQLQQLGIVELVGEGKRNRIFIAREVIRLLNRPTEAERY